MPTNPRRSSPFLPALALMLAAAATAAPAQADRLHDPKARPHPVEPRGPLAESERTTIELFRRASPSVVFIKTTAVQVDPFRMRAYEVPQGAGSGFVWTADGYIVTNFHVVQEARGATVTLADQSTHEAELVGVAPDKDLAVLHIEPPEGGLRPLPIGSSGNLEVGQDVLAIGNPFGLDQTLTTGIISALGREIQSVSGRTISGVIQTDAAINPGNSGGALLDRAGRLIGVNTAIYSPSGAYAGVGFAIPVDTVNRVVPQLIRYGQAVRAGLGVSLAPDEWTRRRNIQGVVVADVAQGSAAAKAGLEPATVDARGRVAIADVIVAVDGKPVSSSDDLFAIFDQHEVGDTITLTVQREGRRVEKSVTLQAVR